MKSQAQKIPKGGSLAPFGLLWAPLWLQLGSLGPLLAPLWTLSFAIIFGALGLKLGTFFVVLAFYPLRLNFGKFSCFPIKRWQLFMCFGYILQFVCCFAAFF